MNDSGIAGPALLGAAVPVSTNMPAPMMAPTPSIVRLGAVRTRRSPVPSSALASAWSEAMLLVVPRLIEGSPLRTGSEWASSAARERGSARTGREGAGLRARLSSNRLRSGASRQSHDLASRRLVRPDRNTAACRPWLGGIIRRFPGDRHVVWMRFPQSSGRDAHEPAVGSQRLDGGAAHVAHAAAQSSHHLEQHVGHWPLIWDSAFDPLGHVFAPRHLAFL